MTPALLPSLPSFQRIKFLTCSRSARASAAPLGPAPPRAAVSLRLLPQRLAQPMGPCPQLLGAGPGQRSSQWEGGVVLVWGRGGRVPRVARPEEACTHAH